MEILLDIVKESANLFPSQVHLRRGERTHQTLRGIGRLDDCRA